RGVRGRRVPAQRRQPRGLICLDVTVDRHQARVTMKFVADTEVVIVGAGPAGSALATMLGMRGVGTVLLDSATFPRDKACGEGLMPSGAQVLRGIGIDVEALPAIRGVTYRVPQAGSVGGEFTDGKFAVGADGLHSRVARWTGWARPPRRPHRYAFTGHVTAPAHRVQSVLVTI